MTDDEFVRLALSARGFGRYGALTLVQHLERQAKEHAERIVAEQLREHRRWDAMEALIPHAALFRPPDV